MNTEQLTATSIILVLALVFLLIGTVVNLNLSYNRFMIEQGYEWIPNVEGHWEKK